MFKIITKKKQAEIDAMTIKKLRFVARATLYNYKLIPINSRADYEFNKTVTNLAMNKAEDVFWADDVL